LLNVALVSSPPVCVLGRYALYDEIACGGMATVHIGRLLGPVGFSRTVAIKRLHRQYAKEPDFVSMFLDEAHLAARIRHPNVVGTLDVVAQDGELFLVMEYVKGESLVRMMRTVRERGEGVPIPIAASIMIGVLEGLHAAHEAVSDQGEPLGIVHRDVSPQNILVGTDGVARVVDFGVAKASGRVQSTRDGQLKGKLGYMAPEQIGGNVTRATDVHAASVVFWEMLTARRLYHGDNELQTYANILAGSVVAPSTHAPKVSAELDKIVLKGLSSNPDARFASAREMARSIQRMARIASASDVGDWVEEIAAPTIRSRARVIAAIESAGALPAVPSSELPESADPGAPSSHAPVSVEPARSPRARLFIAPAVLAALVAGAAIGLFFRASAHPAAATDARPPPALPSDRLPQAPAAWTAAARTPITSASPSTQAPPAASKAPPPARAIAPPAPQGPMHSWAPPPGPPRPQPPAAGSDFAHVMDSRK
jgi:serine/threonine protein kinase